MLLLVYIDWSFIGLEVRLPEEDITYSSMTRVARYTTGIAIHTSNINHQ